MLRVQRQQTLTEFIEQPSWTRQFRIIPLIHVSDRQALWKFWPDIPFGAVAVNYLALRRRPTLYQAALSVGIKSALEYDGICISVLVGDNWQLDNTPVKQYFEDVTKMEFDAATTHDDYVYESDPKEYRYSRIHKTLDRAYEFIQLKPKFDVIGIVKGASPSEIEFCVDRLCDMGIRSIAFPCSELAFEERYDTIWEFLRYGEKMHLWRWLIGIGSPQLMLRFDANCFSSSKWFYSATFGYEMSGQKVRQTSDYPDCKHKLCSSLRRHRVQKQVIRARHNVLSLIELNRQLRRKSLG
jgi:hypothetical protein